ncbi:MAG: hypothetical protein K1X28_01780 [Parachlamydiales bacterium]|nr:hypothetical protein [Parachlamydiales bacterium]
MKKAILLSLTACLFAEPNDYEQLKSRIEALEQRPITPSFKPCARTGKGILFSVTPLYWRVSEEGLEYAITNSFEFDSVSEDIFGTQIPLFYRMDVTNGKTHKPDFDWNWGFRVGASYDTPYDGWDLSSYWTDFHHKTHDSIHTSGDPDPNDITTGSGTGTFISPLWIAKLFSAPGLMNVASAKWKLGLDLIDLELGRRFLVSQYLSLRPFIALRAGWIHQQYRLFFQTPNINLSPTSIPPSGEGNGREIVALMRNNFWGIGPRVGLNSQWLLGKGFSVYGNAAFSLLTGRFKVRYKLMDQKPVLTRSITVVGMNLQVNSSPAFNDSFENSNRVSSVSSIADLGLGLRWDTTARSNTLCFSVWAGYDQNIFFSQNQFMNYQYDFTLLPNNTSPFGGGSGSGGAEGPSFFSSRGNLTASGFSGGIEIGF